MKNNNLNNNLNLAKNAKKDEFYTELSTIENELIHYEEHFKGKIIYLNCDNPRKSNFFKYFLYNFEKLGLKKLIASCYKNQNLDLFNMENEVESAIWTEYEGVSGGELKPTMETIELNYFEGDGDFRSEESIEFLKQADIVITNPPFSLFREYIAQLMEYDKKFIVLGNMNAITCKEIFPLIKDNKMWPGVAFNKSMKFEVPEHYNISKAQIIDNKHYVRVHSVSWWTNLDHSRRHKDLTLTKEYKDNEEYYPKYNDFNAINIDRVADVPKDYQGILGVPITFIGQWNPNQFEIIGMDRYTAPKEALHGGRLRINGKSLYARILIKNKTL